MLVARGGGVDEDRRAAVLKRFWGTFDVLAGSGGLWCSWMDAAVPQSVFFPRSFVDSGVDYFSATVLHFVGEWQIALLYFSWGWCAFL